VALVKDLTVVKQQLDASRPTAVNLSWVSRLLPPFCARNLKTLRALQATKILLDIAQVLQENDASVDFIRWKILEEAHVLCEEDVAANRAMGELGAQLVAPGANILHHCNTGALATVDVGTALGVIYTCHAQGKGIHVWVDETRPRLQGSRLTAWELQQGGVPLHLIADNAAGHLMQNGKVDIILYGADRVAANGDTANKIGTYKISVVGRENGIPVYPVVPTSTIDLTVPTGKDIPIEERGEEEVSTVFGTRIAPEGVPVFNPAFDVTPAKYISGIITEEGIAYPPFTLSLPKMVRAAEARRQEKWAAKLFAIKAELAELAGAQQ